MTTDDQIIFCLLGGLSNCRLLLGSIQEVCLRPELNWDKKWMKCKGIDLKCSPQLPFK